MSFFMMCSSLMAIVTCLTGLQIGHVIVHFKVPIQRLHFFYLVDFPAYFVVSIGVSAIPR